MIFHNTKLINLGETEVSFFYLYCWLLFFLSERCRQPLATLRERLHLSERDTLLLHFVLELANVDASSASGRLMMHIFASLAEFERDLIVDRCQSGREEAKKRGVKFGRHKKKKEAKTKACAALYKDNIPLNEIMSQLGIKSKATVYRYLRLEKTPISRKNRLLSD